MNISDQFQQIGIFLAQDRFISVLKKVTAAAVSLVEIPGVSGQQSPHNGGYGNLAGF